MSGNTRGKLKEHFEGIHRNFDWIQHHIGQSGRLLEQQLSQLPAWQEANGDAAKEQVLLDKHPISQALKSLSDGIQTFDEIVQGIYGTL